MNSVVAELEGALVKDPDPFSYFMLVAFEASGPIRFAVLLLFWPIIRLLRILGKEDAGLRLTIFIAVVGLRVSEIEYVGRAVLPKFYMDHIDLDVWRMFSQYGKKVVVTKTPRLMVEWFVKEHLRADEVFGSELLVNRFGFATGLVRDVGSFSGRFDEFFGDEKPCLGLGRCSESKSDLFMSFCQEQCRPPYSSTHNFIEGNEYQDNDRPSPVIFRDGRLVKQPTPLTAVIILCWIPMGIIVAIIRMVLILTLPLTIFPYEKALYGVSLIVKGHNNYKPLLMRPSGAALGGGGGGVLFVCNHRTPIDPIIVSHALRRTIPALTYSISRVSEIFAPIPTIRLTRNREVDAKKIKEVLKKTDLVICPEGTTCREPFLLRFSALFAELTDQIVPVATNYTAQFFHPSTVRGWKGLDPFIFFMNPTCTYEVTFLDQLPFEATCSAGKSPVDVANHVQQELAATLGFKCTNLTRTDKYRLLKGQGSG